MSRKRRRGPRDARVQMIAETSAFLTWALRDGQALPRIPTRRVSAGGFGGLGRRAGMRSALRVFWDRTLAAVGSQG